MVENSVSEWSVTPRTPDINNEQRNVFIYLLRYIKEDMKLWQICHRIWISLLDMELIVSMTYNDIFHGFHSFKGKHSYACTAIPLSNQTEFANVKP